jgi:hypothetical protein
VGYLRLREVRYQHSIRLGIFLANEHSDLVAEHDPLQRGIEHLVETIALPYRPVHNSRSMLCWLAELSIRRLLNRVHRGLYGESTHLPTKFKALDDMQQGRNEFFAHRNGIESSIELMGCPTTARDPTSRYP